MSETASTYSDTTIQVSTEKATDEPPPRIRIARYDQYFDQRTFSTTLRKTSKPVNHKKVNKKKPLLIVRRIIDSRGQYQSTEVDIKSEALCDLLLTINEDVYGLTLTKSRAIADTHLFFHSHSALLSRRDEESTKSQPDTSLVEDLDTALQFIAEEHNGPISDLARLTSLGQITYDLLWALFAPNTYVYRYHPYVEQHQVLICRRISYERTSSGQHYASLVCDVVTDNGSVFGLAREYLEIQFFPGTSKIQDLSIYPLSYHSDNAGVYEHAVRRGKKFAGITRQLFETSGFAFAEKANMLGDAKMFKFNTFGRVMIDPAAFRLFEPNNSINLSVYSALEGRDHLKDEQYLICTPVVLGFCFGTKMWGGFALDRLLDVVWSEEAFHQLVLGEKQKQLIRALIRRHSMHVELFDDIVVGKGQGLVGLLSGNPGCGKTLTAEAAAEITHSPLYVVSAGELGTEPEDVDTRLARILELAHMWNAVLLLDEADVFLHRRSTADLKRNALVSIFLRQLEYYRGILILTTNMVAQCDPAFESRIHFCIQYPDLDFTSRKAVWKTFIRKALKDPTGVSEEDVDRLSEHKMNGRQIKNAVSTAQCIALDQGSQLSVEHIETVLATLNDWDTVR